MLTADQITALGDKAQRITDPIVEFLIQDISRRVRQAGQLTSTASYQIWRLQNLGMSQKQVQEEIRKRLNVSLEQVEQLLTQSAEVGYNFDLKNLPHAGAVPFAENAAVQQIVSAGVKMAQDDLSNMVQTLGFVTQNGKAETLTEAYRQVCDFAFQKVVTGAQDYNSAIRQATKGLAERGIVSIDYESGRSVSVEAAVRRNVMSALGLMQEQITQQNHDDLGCDGWEISAHMASAPDHEPIQGKQFSDEAYIRLNNNLIRRIGTLNCGHAAFPIILGVNEPQYSPEELEQFRKANKDGIEYEGRHYTMYEATQRQRKLERAIRHRKRRILIDEQLGDKEQLAVDQTRLVVLNGEYARFSKAAGLRSQRERTTVAGFGTKEAGAAKKRPIQTVNAFQGNNGIQKPDSKEKQPPAEALSIATINTRGTRNMIAAYDRRRLHFDLNMVPGEDILSSPINSFVQDYTGISVETADAFETTIANLSEKYYTGLTRVEVGNPRNFLGSGVFASVSPAPTVGANTLVINPLKTKDYSALKQRIREMSNKGHCVKIPDEHLGEYVATHEFAHTLINMKVDSYKNYVGIDVKYFERAKKELVTIYDQYVEKVRYLEGRRKTIESQFFLASNQAELVRIQKEFAQAKSELASVKISQYSLLNPDEFMAESFTDCMIGESPSEYSKMVLAVLDRYFGRK